MEWGNLARSWRNRGAVRIVLSAVWIALVIVGARLTNFNEPYLPFAVAGAFVFLLRGAPSRWDIYAGLVIAVVFVKIIQLPQTPFWVLRVASGLAALGFAAILLLGLRALWSERDGRENGLALLVPSLILILFIFVSGNVLRLSGSLNFNTDDAWLYAFDGSLGFQPSFLMGKIMYGSVILTRSAMLTYLSLPFAMAVVCAWQIRAAARKISWHMLTVLLLAGVAGYLLYNVVPATGPIYAFGKDFPWNGLSYNALSTFALQKMPISTGIPRNGMPSLHVAWVVLLFWNSRGFPKVLRGALLLYVLLTVFATLGSGQHYLVDLIVSLPFALAVQATASSNLPHRSRSTTAILAGAGLTGVWLLFVRFGVPLALLSPLIPWSGILLTVSITFWLESRLLKSSVSSLAKDKILVAAPRLAVRIR